MTLLAAAALAPLQADRLAVTDVHATYGVLGPPRPDTKFLPGDELFLSFAIQGAKVSPDRKILYSIGMEVTNQMGKVQTKQLPQDLEAEVPSGGPGLPACATVPIGLDQEPGKYTIKLSVTDRIASATRELSRTFEILPPAFGLVRLQITKDPEGKIPVPSLQKGRTACINFVAVGFGRSPSSKQPQISVVMRVLDASGRVVEKPFKGEIGKEVPANARSYPMLADLEVNRTGKFTIELTANDHATRKTSNISFPVTVANVK
jgi:hypothetical protein